MTMIRKHDTPAFKTQVVQEALAGERTLAQLAAQYGIHPNLITKWKRAALHAMPSAFTENAPLEAQLAALQAEHEREKEALYAEIGRLTTQVHWLQKKLQQEVPRAVRRTLVERASGEVPLSTQAQLLSVSRSSLYYRPVPPSAEEIALKHRIDAIFTECPFSGSRRITAQLRRDGMLVNRKAVQRHMREMGLEAIGPGPGGSKRQPGQQVYPYLLRDLAITKPNQVWGIDITSIRLRHGWMYLVALLDWYSRYVVSWELDQTLEIDFVLAAVQRALARAQPGIVNSDQGSHFTSPQYVGLIQATGAQISMDGKGRALDNVFTERLWRTVKYENVYLQDYSAPREARAGIGTYLEFYNQRRPHQSLGYRTPAEVYFAASSQGRTGGTHLQDTFFSVLTLGSTIVREDSDPCNFVQ
jgi:putative transposase